MNGWKSYNYEARNPIAGLILYDFLKSGRVVASIFQKDEDDFLNDIVRVWDWLELSETNVFELDYRRNKGRDEIFMAQEYVERKFALDRAVRPSGRFGRKAKKAQDIDFSMFDGFVKPSAHEFMAGLPITSADFQTSDLDTFLTEISQDFGGM